MSSRLVLRTHALKRMAENGISVADVHTALATGSIIRVNSHDRPHPSRLVLAWIGDRPIHVVAADDQVTGETYIITAYEPDPKLWQPDFRRRRQ